MDNTEKIIKSKKRVKQHGEVFTPRRIVRDMITLPDLYETLQEFDSTVLEPACGEGIFIVEILKERLKKVREQCSQDLVLYENLALFSLTTLYGIELLEDNAQKCVINIYETFINDYNDFVNETGKCMKKKVLDSAKTIISVNIVEGNFLEKKTTSGTPIVFSEWRVIKDKKKSKVIKVQRTEFTLEEIMDQEEHSSGEIYKEDNKDMPQQMSLFDIFDAQEVIPGYEEKKKKDKQYRYKIVKLSDVYRETKEEVEDEEKK